MEDYSFEKLPVDYYNTTNSYVKAIIDLLPEGRVSGQDKAFIISIYNYIMNSVSKVKRIETAYISSLFIDKLSLLPEEEINKQVDYLYSNFLHAMIYDSVNRTKLFNIMNECVKVFVGYYSAYQVVNINSDNGVQIEKGSYR